MRTQIFPSFTSCGAAAPKHAEKSRLAASLKQKRRTRPPYPQKVREQAGMTEAGFLIGYILRQERIRQKITQTRLTDELQFGATALSTMEAGRAFANVDRMITVVRRLGLDPASLIESVSAQKRLHAFLQSPHAKEDV